MCHFRVMGSLEFQSTLPRGERPNGFSINANRITKISIHAPARGATSVRCSGGVSGRFQSTLPRGERLCAAALLLNRPEYFNPRSREGSDDDVRLFFDWYSDFNPRSREGSDPIMSKKLFHDLNFNPRSREGSDHSAQRDF